MKRMIVAAILPLACAVAQAEERVVEVKIRADSEHPGMEAFRAMDGNPGSIWHTRWRPAAAVTALPHEIVVDLGGVYEISGFTYVPRTGSRNGRIKDYEAYLSGPDSTSRPLADSIGEPVARGAFANPDGENTVTFPAPVKGRYFRLRALSNVTGEGTWSGIGDLKLHCEGVQFVGKPWPLGTGELRLPGVIGNHMVLQRDVPPVIWGWGAQDKEVTVALGADNTAKATADGRGAWQVTLQPMQADGISRKLVVSQITDDGEHTIELDDIVIGDVWIGAGESNMEWDLARSERAGQAVPQAGHPKIRLFRVPKVQVANCAADVYAAWQVCSPQTVPGFSAVLYHFGRRLHKELDVPVGLIQAAWSGSPIELWTSAGGKSGRAYNGMIAPLVPFRIRGVIWYQGETNVMHEDGFGYFHKMKALIEGWRHEWGTEFPFYFVQIAPWAGRLYAPGRLPALWEAQVAGLTIPKTGMVVASDIVDDMGDMHPRNKRDVGERLALWVLAKDHGRKDLVYSGPLYESMKVEGNKIRLRFAHVGGGLKSRDGKPLTEFQIAGADGKCVPATATIGPSAESGQSADTVLVHADAVASPTQVRFGWHKTANPNLMNKEGLPASPFRTDGWRGGTGETASSRFAAAIAPSGPSEPAAARERKGDALLFMIAGCKNAEGQAAFSKESNDAAGIIYKVMPGSTAADIGLPVAKEAYPNSYIWSLAENQFEPLTPGKNLLANVRRGSNPMGDPNRHGLELPLAHRLQQRFPGEDIFFVKVAQEGTALYQEWKPGEDAMYKTLIDAYRKATADLEKRYANVKVLGFYWDQCDGEFKFEVGSEPMKKYPENLGAFVEAVRAETKQWDLRIFMPKQMFHKVQSAWRPLVTSQQAFCKEDPNGVLIDIDRGRYGTNMKLWSWTSNGNALGSKAFAAIADRIATEVILAERTANRIVDGSPNTKRPAIVLLVAGQSNAGGTATLSIAHRMASGFQGVWPADPEIAGENCGVPVSDEAYADCYVALNNPQFARIAPASAIKACEAAFASQGTSKREYRHGIELPAAYRMRRQFPDNDIYVIKVCSGGKNLYENWNPDVRGQLFDQFMGTVPAALNNLSGKYPEVRVVGLYWDQGESDTGPEAVRYEGIFRKLIARMRSGTRLPNLKVFTRKHLYGHHVPGERIVNKAMATVVAEDPDVYLLDIDLRADVDNEPNFDAWSCTFRNIHIGSKAFKELTRLIFDECIPDAEAKDLLLYER